MAIYQIIEHDADKFSLIFSEFDQSEAIFNEYDMEGGGYAWHAVLDALIRLHAPELIDTIDFDPEGSMFAAVSRSQKALEQLGSLLEHALDDEDFLREGIENADLELLD